MQRALQRLNGGDAAAKELGKAYSSINREKIVQQQAADEEAGIVKLEPWERDMLRRKTHAVPKHVSDRGIAVPRVGAGRRYERPPPIAFVQHRRTADEVRAENHGYAREMAPRCAPARSSDEKKEELATRNQFAGKTPEEVLREQAQPRRGGGAGGGGKAVLTEKQQMDQMRNDIADEIAERQEFLDVMTAAGRGNEYAMQLQGEIAERVSDLRRLEKLSLD